MHKGEYIRCIRLSYDNNSDSTYYGKYAKCGAIWVKSTEIGHGTTFRIELKKE